MGRFLPGCIQNPMRSIRLALLSVALSLAVSAQTLLQLQPGDHVAIVGGGIADRMQHTG